MMEKEGYAVVLALGMLVDANVPLMFDIKDQLPLSDCTIQGMCQSFCLIFMPIYIMYQLLDSGVSCYIWLCLSMCCILSVVKFHSQILNIQDVEGKQYS